MFYRFLYLGFKIYCFIFRPIRMGVRVVMVEDGKAWLVRHTYLPGWYLQMLITGEVDKPVGDASLVPDEDLLML